MTISFDAVLFDLDGTLVATDRFWPEAARAGALRAFAELGLDREPPSRETWMRMVGYPLDVGFAEAFGDLDEAARERIQALCVEEEENALRSGGAALLPGVAGALETLSEAGIRLGIASNCGRSYLDAMMSGLGLSRWVAEARCLDSPGVRDKADMVEDLLHTFETRSAVMVGDRVGDRNAAWANGLPHVHLTRGFAPRGEEFECEATLEGLDELVPLLERRAAWLEGALQALALDERASRVHVVGPMLSGKTLLTRDLASALRRSGRSVRVERPGVAAPAPGPPGAAGDLVLVDGGPWPASVGPADRLVRLTASPEVRYRRLEGREGRLEGPSRVFERVEADRQAAPGAPPRPVDLELDGNNVLGPAPLPA